jgi:putative ABC transport system ATP-binding protein
MFDNLTYSDIKDINKFRRENVGFVFQFHYLIEYLTVKENIQLASKDNDYLDELLAYLEIENLKDKLPNQISGGQRQRVALARALISKPKVIFADEPTGNLDRKNSQNVFKLLKNISKNGTTIITATHDLELSQLSDKIVEITDGRI